MNEPWFKKIHEAQTAEVKAHLTTVALDDYSRKIAMACACPECDVPLVVTVLHQYIDGYEKQMNMPQRIFTKMLTEVARESLESIEIRLPMEKRP